MRFSKEMSPKSRQSIAGLPTVETNDHEEKSSERVPGPYILLLFGFYLLLTYIIIVIENDMPTVIRERDIPNDDSNTFSEENAKNYLNRILGDQPRVAGTLYHLIKTRDIKDLVDEIASKANIPIRTDWQFVSGDYWLASSSPHVNSYQNLSNIIAVLEGESGFHPNGTTGTSLLVNCHYDSVPYAIGASDNGVFCAAMAETLSKLSRRKTKLKHNIIFLFNGAEESILLGSHGFLSHPWSKGVTNVVNLDSAGMNGKPNVFQVTDSRVLEAYKRTCSKPNAQGLGEVLFASGIIPSDTDFRIFRDFGGIYGVDIAFIKGGNVYHTRNDRPELIEDGVIQNAGNMLLSLVRELADSQELENKESPSSEVYYDYMGLFLVTYSKSTALFVDLFIGLLGLSSVVYFLWLFGLRWSSVKELLWAIVGRVVCVVCGLVAVILMTVVMVGTTTQMKYLSEQWMVVPLYIGPYVIAMTAASHGFDSWRSSKVGGWTVGWVTGGKRGLLLHFGTAGDTNSQWDRRTAYFERPGGHAQRLVSEFLRRQILRSRVRGLSSRASCAPLLLTSLAGFVCLTVGRRGKLRVHSEYRRLFDRRLMTSRRSISLPKLFIWVYSSCNYSKLSGNTEYLFSRYIELVVIILLHSFLRLLIAVIYLKIYLYLEYTTPGWQYLVLEVVLTLPATSLCLSLAVRVLPLLVPIMGRSGSDTPDYLIAAISVALVTLAVATVSGLELLFGGRVCAALLCACALCVCAALVPLRPYRGHTTQRHYWFHSQITTYDRNLTPVENVTGVLVSKLDVYSVQSALQAIKESPLYGQDSGMKKIDRQTNKTVSRNNGDVNSFKITDSDLNIYSSDKCDKYVYCDLPLYTTRFGRFVKGSLFITMGPPAEFEHSLKLVNRSCVEDSCVLSFIMHGPAYSALSVWPRPAVRLRAWSLRAAPLPAGAPLGRALFVVTHFTSTYSDVFQPLEFSLTFSVPRHLQSDILADISHHAHRVYHPEHFTTEYRMLLDVMPEYFNIATSLSFRSNYVF
ncbi:uncharacterized protein LOC126777488 [Nymphalis io]|uniref:uncharacterized protein LOC126777488 n=1 Tax=Inachis io TaxID=171585 RepID=UPI00216700CE|nr:uncharacterized protein LOC126777488 [Nymphalis io]